MLYVLAFLFSNSEMRSSGDIFASIEAFATTDLVIITSFWIDTLLFVVKAILLNWLAISSGNIDDDGVGS